MLAISDESLHARHTPLRVGANAEFILLALLFGCVGAIAWAIRGTSGWGGIDGVIVPGMAWGILWYWVCRCRGVDARGIGLWLGMGVSIGGEWGYGQYVGWIRGIFEVGDETIHVASAHGYFWFVLIGVAWAAPGGIALGWLLGGTESLHRWLTRIVAPLGVALLGRMLIQIQPGWFFPNYSLGIYVPQPGTELPPVSFIHTSTFMIGAWCVAMALIAVSWIVSRRAGVARVVGWILSILSVAYTAGLLYWMGLWLFFPNDSLGLFTGELGKHLGRTVYTNAQNAIVIAWWVGALLVAALQRDKTTLVMGSLLGFGFGVGMVLSALWCLGYGVNPQYIDWWKMWELNAGFNLGIVYVLAMCWALRRAGTPLDRPAKSWTFVDAWCRPLASAAGVLLVFLYIYYEDGRVAGWPVGAFYVAAVTWICIVGTRRHDPSFIRDRQQSLALHFCVFYFLFFAFHGVTNRMGVILELYDDSAVDQYQFPPERIWLLMPFVIATVAVTLYHIGKISRATLVSLPMDRLSVHIGNMIMLVGIVGAFSIWPSKIGVVYSVVLFFAMYAFVRLALRYQVLSRV